MALTTNQNFLSPVGFRLTLRRAPNLEFFLSQVEIPTITLANVVQPNPLVNIHHPGDRLDFSDLSLTFRVDEDMQNYLEIYNWLMGLGFPETPTQYRQLVEKPATDEQGIMSDGSILVLTSNNNANVRFSFVDMFPTSLSSLNFNVSETDLNYLEASVVFRYRNFTIEKL